MEKMRKSDNVASRTDVHPGFYTRLRILLSAMILFSLLFAVEKRVCAAASIADARMTIYTGHYESYDGSEHCPEVKLEYCDPDSGQWSVLEEGVDYRIVYSNNINAGTATVTATGMGNYSGTVSGTFEISKAAQNYGYSNGPLTIAVGDTAEIEAECDSGKVSFRSSDTSIATVNSSGVITAKSAGTVTITIIFEETQNYREEETEITYTIVGFTAPTVTVTNCAVGVKLRWTRVTGASGYYIYRSSTKNGSYTLIDTVKYSGRLYYTDYPDSYEIYYYKVAAYGDSVTGPKSDAVGIKNLSVGIISGLINRDEGISVRWTEVEGASGYYIYRKTEGGSYSKVKTISSASTVLWIDTDVKSKNGTTYVYYVQAFYKGNSLESLGAYAEKSTVRLTAPSLTEVTSPSASKLSLKWKKATSGNGYQVQYSTTSGFVTGNRIDTVTSLSKVSEEISNLTKGKTYYVRIRTYQTSNGRKYYSAWSESKKVTITK